MPHSPASAALARRRLCAELGSRGVPPEVMDDLALVVSELVGNAVRHACPLPSGGLHVNWLLEEGTVDVAVSDGGGQDRPRAQQADPEAQSGRGLAIVAALARRWGVRDDGDARTVWAELTSPPQPARRLSSVGTRRPA